MTSLNIQLPETMRAFIEEQAVNGGFTDASEYLQALIRKEQQREAQERLEALLLEGLESGPATPMTDEDWDRMRQAFDERGKLRQEIVVGLEQADRGETAPSDAEDLKQRARERIRES